MEYFSLKNRVAVVTGAVGLLGKQHCQSLAESGASLVVCDLEQKECEGFAESLPTDSMGCRLDVTDRDSIVQVRDQVLNKYARIDVLVNNAAINDMVESPKARLEESRFENYPLQLWQQSIDVNLTGVFLCCQVMGAAMVRQGSGSIINVASTYGVVAPNQDLYRDRNDQQLFFKPPAYSATKGAIISFTKYLAAYWGNAGIRVNTLTPGGVENNQDAFFIQKYSEKTPLGRMARPGDYRGALLFLASDASSYMTGANLIVDGGWTAW